MNNEVPNISGSCRLKRSLASTDLLSISNSIKPLRRDCSSRCEHENQSEEALSSIQSGTNHPLAKKQKRIDMAKSGPNKPATEALKRTLLSIEAPADETIDDEEDPPSRGDPPPTCFKRGLDAMGDPEMFCSRKGSVPDVALKFSKLTATREAVVSSSPASESQQQRAHSVQKAELQP